MISKEKFLQLLINKYGPIVSGEDLVESLGYRSLNAFRQARHQGTVPIKIFRIENRRGYHALVVDIADWLLAQRNQ